MPDSEIHPGLRAQLDQGLSEAVDGLVAKAAEHDGQDLIEANTEFANWLNASPLSRVQLAAAGAALALRLHRIDAGRSDEPGPSPAQLGDTMTVAPGEWAPLDDLGTEIYVYGDRSVDVAVQRADVDNEVRQLRAEVETRARNEACLVNAFESLTKDANGNNLDPATALVVGKIRRALHEARTPARPYVPGGES